jgi:hypothetical protein
MRMLRRQGAVRERLFDWENKRFQMNQGESDTTLS